MKTSHLWMWTWTSYYFQASVDHFWTIEQLKHFYNVITVVWIVCPNLILDKDFTISKQLLQLGLAGRNCIRIELQYSSHKKKNSSSEAAINHLLKRKVKRPVRDISESDRDINYCEMCSVLGCTYTPKLNSDEFPFLKTIAFWFWQTARGVVFSSHCGPYFWRCRPSIFPAWLPVPSQS